MVTATIEDAMARHRAAEAADHGCGPRCSGTIAEAVGIDAEDLRSAWLGHWQSDPAWHWNEQHFEDTDHRCEARCAAAIAGRLTNRP